MLGEGVLAQVDAALEFGQKMDWATPMAGVINAQLGVDVIYGIWVDYVSHKLALSVLDVRDMLRERGVVVASDEIMDGAYSFNVPTEQRGWAEHLMNEWGVMWYGGVTSWREWMQWHFKGGRNWQTTGGKNGRAGTAGVHGAAAA